MQQKLNLVHWNYPVVGSNVLISVQKELIEEEEEESSLPFHHRKSAGKFDSRGISQFDVVSIY